MAVVSLTFHTANHRNADWQNYLEKELPEIIENLFDVEKFMLSDVESEMITEGTNTNLLLFFSDAEKRDDFLGIELMNISERIAQIFADDVLIFTTILQPRSSRL